MDGRAAARHGPGARPDRRTAGPGRAIAAAGPGAGRTYGNYWQRMLTAWGDRRLDQITASDVEAMQRTAAATARSRRNSRHGRHAGEHVVAAARAIYNRAIADGLIAPGASPPTA